MNITNFTLIDFQNGNTLNEADLDSLFGGIHTTFDSVIFNLGRVPLLPDSFTGENKIASVIPNSFFSVDPDGDVVLVSRQSLDDLVAAAAASAATALNAPGTSATSTTSLTLSAEVKSLTLTQTGKTFAVGQYVSITSTSNPDLQWMTGGITSYNSVTGHMSVNVTRFEGIGSNTSWTVTLSAPASRTSSTTATSTTTLTPTIGSNAFTITQGGKDFSVGQYVTVADAVTPTTKFFNGAITSFNPLTRAIVVDAIKVQGGTGSSWVIASSAPAQSEKFVSPLQTFVALGNVSGTTNIDLRVALKYSMTLTGNTTLTFTMPEIFTSATETEVILLITKSGSQTLSLPFGTQWHDGAAPSLTTGGTDELVFTKQGSSNWIGGRSRKAIA